MKVMSSTVAMVGSSTRVQRQTRESQLRVWTNNQQRQGGPANAQKAATATSPLTKRQDPTDLVCEKERHKLVLIKQFIKALTGKEIEVVTIDELLQSHQDRDGGRTASTGPISNSRAIAQPPATTWGLELEYHEIYEEEENLVFAAQGSVVTAAGQKLEFAVELKMSHYFRQQRDIYLRVGSAPKVDPLVLSLNGEPPTLTREKHEFDLDGDGQAERVSLAGPGSGFLAIDRDGDGSIGSGLELFGPSTGDGFAQLRQHDDDSNNWIDQGDEVFERLRIWVQSADGKDLLYALPEQGIGAIYLGSISTLFHFKDGAATDHGTLKQTGLYVKEDGTAGTIHHIDLTV